MKMSLLKESLGVVLNAGMTPFIVGAPGTGKSSASYQVAAARGKPVRTWSVFRPGIEDPTDGKGIPVPAGDHHVWLPGECVARLQRGEEEVRRTTILVDDAPQGVPMVTNAYAPLAQREPDGTRRIGPHIIPAETEVIFTGNRKEDKSATHEMGGFMRDRLVYLRLVFDWRDFNAEMTAKKWNTRVMTFLKHNAHLAQAYDPSVDKSPTCRGWDKVSQIENLNPSSQVMQHIVCGIVGEGAGIQYMETRGILDKMPDIVAIGNTGIGVVPKEASIQYCMALSISRCMDRKNVANFMQYLAGFPPEMVDVIQSELSASEERCALLATPAWANWLSKYKSRKS